MPSSPSFLAMSDSFSYDSLKLSPLAAQSGIDEVPQMHRSKNSRVKQNKRIPAGWRPPTSTFPLLIFRAMCFCLTFHSDLDFMWEIFRKPKGWEDFHVQYLSQINQLSTVQGLVLTTVAVFISTQPPVGLIEYTAYVPYTLLSESLVFSLFGLLFQLYISVIGQSYKKQKTFKALKKNRWLFLCHILILSIPVYVFSISLLLLLFAISVTGFLSPSTSAQIFTGATFALLCVCLIASIIPSPFYSRLYETLWKTKHLGDNDNDDDDDDDDDEDELEESRAKTVARGTA